MKRAITPGTFDPITKGHVEIITRAAGLVDELIVGVAASLNKKPLFSIEERVDLATEATAHLCNVRVEAFDDLLVEFARKTDSQIIIKGLRAMTDFEYEFQLNALNDQLNAKFETMFIMSDPKYMYLSSSIVREIASLGGDLSIFVTPYTALALQNKFTK